VRAYLKRKLHSDHSIENPKSPGHFVHYTRRSRSIDGVYTAEQEIEV